MAFKKPYQLQLDVTVSGQAVGGVFTFCPAETPQSLLLH